MFWCLIFWDWMYYWWCIIYRHHFCLNLAFSYFLYSLTLMFSLKHVVSLIRLRLHVTQEVPLPPYFLINFVTLRTMFSLVGGRVEEESFVINAKLFWQFSCFLLNFNIFKFLFYSPWLLRKNSQIKMREIKFFFLDLVFVLCLLKLMNCLSFYWIQAYVFHYKLFTHYAQ